MDIKLIILAVIILLLLILYFRRNKEGLINEHLTDNTTSDVLNADINNYRLSKFGNIITSQDVDMTKQEVDVDGEDNSLDNEDTIDQVITRGTSLFHSKPDSFSPTVNHNSFDMKKKYNIGLTGKQDVDEMLARKQSQRGALNRDAMTGAARHTANTYKNSFTDELDENEQRVWWSSEAQPLETDWTPY